MGMPFRVWVDWAFRIRESVPPELMGHFTDHRAAVLASVWPVVDDFGISEGEICHIPLRK